jgi:hypothetical protein
MPKATIKEYSYLRPVKYDIGTNGPPVVGSNARINPISQASAP